MIKYLILACSLVAVVSCRSTSDGSSLASSTGDSMSSVEINALSFFKDRGLNINPKTLAIESFVNGSAPEALNSLNVGDVLAEVRVLITRNSLLEPYDKPVESLSRAGSILQMRTKDKNLAVTLRFNRQSQDGVKMFGVTVHSGI